MIRLYAISMNYLLIDVNWVNIWRSLFYHFFYESFFWKSFYFKRKHPIFNLHLDKIQIILTFFPVKFYLASIVIELVLILKRIIAFRSLLKRKKSLIEKKSGILDQGKIFEACWYDVCMWTAMATNPHLIKSKIFFWYQLSLEKIFYAESALQ